MVGAFGEVQVMDWGLAKVLPREPASIVPDENHDNGITPTEIRVLRTPQGEYTQSGSVLGTPAYMAPEQAAGETDRLDTRSDVFGLGAILCAMLTGKPPYGGTSAEQVRRVAARGETDEAFARLDESGADPEMIALCKRCLAFEPVDRPATGNALAQEVSALRRAAETRARQAEQEKVAAEARAAEQLVSQQAQQRASAAISLILLLALSGVLVALVWANNARLDAEDAQRQTNVKNKELQAAWKAEEKQRHQTEAKQTEAKQTEAKQTEAKQTEAKQTEANALADFLESQIVAAARPVGQNGGLGKDVGLRDVLNACLPVLPRKFAKLPLVEARVRQMLGDTYYYLGDMEQARAQHIKARELIAALLDRDHAQWLKTCESLANIYIALNRHGEAMREAQSVYQSHRLKLDNTNPVLLRAQSLFAKTLVTTMELDRAMEMYQEVLQVQRTVLPQHHLDISDVLVALSKLQLGSGDYENALKSLEEVLVGYQKELPAHHPDTLVCMYYLAECYQGHGLHEKAYDLRQKVWTVRQQIFPVDHLETLRSQWSVAESLMLLDRADEAARMLDDCVARVGRHQQDGELLWDILKFRVMRAWGDRDPDGCRRAAETWEKLRARHGGDYILAARLRSLSASAYAEFHNPVQAKLEADRAMWCLHQAVRARSALIPWLPKFPELRYLYDRPDFLRIAPGARPRK